MPSTSRSAMRAWGSNPPGRPSMYFMVASATLPSRAPMPPMTPMPLGLPSTLPSTSNRSLPSRSMIIRGARSRQAGSMYFSHRSTGSRMCPSASMTLYGRPMAHLLAGMLNKPSRACLFTIGRTFDLVQRKRGRLAKRGTLPHRQSLLSIHGHVLRRRWSGAPSAGTASLEGRHHVPGEELEAPHLQLRWDAAAGIGLGHDAVEVELLAQPGQAVDHALGGAECHLAGQDVVEGEAGHSVGLRLAAVGGPGPGAPDGRSGQLGLADEEGGEALAGLLHRSLRREGHVDRDAEVDARRAGVTRLPPGLSIRGELRLQIGDLR